MPRTHIVAPLLLVLGCTLACPARTPTPQSEAEADRSPAGVPVADPNDPRLVRDTDDLYAAEDAPHQPEPTVALGSGRPDTSNGVCKLFAPKLPKPECCPQETGFDAEKVQKLCGHALYMGESLHLSCGYYFLHDADGGYPLALRASKLNVESVSEAAAAHDQRIAHTFKLPGFESTPVPGVEGAMWSHHDGIHWAFIPGWSMVRLVSWTEDACSIDAMPEVLKVMVEAKEVPAHAPRPGLIPIARSRQ